MYRQHLFRTMAIFLCAISIQAFAKDDRYFVGFDAGQANYTHNETNAKDTDSVLFFNVGQLLDNNIYVAATVGQYQEVFITDNNTHEKTGYKISGLQFSVGKELPIYSLFTMSADIDLTHWTEKRKTTDLNNASAAPTTEIIKAYSLGVGYNLNLNVSDKTKVSLRFQGTSTENFGFINTLVSMKFEI